MNRRTLLKALPLGLASLAGAPYAVRKLNEVVSGCCDSGSRFVAGPLRHDPIRDEGALAINDITPPDLNDPFAKAADPDRTYSDDFVLPAEQRLVLNTSAAKVSAIRDLVGHGNFNILSFDRMLQFASNYSHIGRFTKEELDLLDELFFADAKRYGFFGEKVVTEQTVVIRDQDVHKVPGSGHYLLKGESLNKFRQISRDIGDSITLTSGIRSVAKQYQLFLNKAVESEGNLSRASRSLAPPGYSFHARGDFDLGKVGFGLGNFTASFCETVEYRKMIDLGYVSIRYTERNRLGVRHEPWHIKIA